MSNISICRCSVENFEKYIHRELFIEQYIHLELFIEQYIHPELFIEQVAHNRIQGINCYGFCFSV